jgi:hypothetical protein
MGYIFKSLRGSFFTLLEIIIVLAIVLFMAQKMLKNYFDSPIKDKQTETIAHEAGIDTANYQSVMQSTKDKINNIMDQRQRDLDHNFNTVK